MIFYRYVGTCTIFFLDLVSTTQIHNIKDSINAPVGDDGSLYLRRQHKWDYDAWVDCKSIFI